MTFKEVAQSHGPGMKQKKLIWINDFQKEGYHRKAKIENYKDFMK